MKRIAIILFTIASLSANAQFGAGIGAGYSTKGSAAVKLDLSYRLPFGLTLETGYNVHVDKKNPAILNARAGYQFSLSRSFAIRATAGYGYYMVSNDKIGANHWGTIGGIELIKSMNDFDRGQWFLNVSQADKITFVTLGLRALIFQDK